jgi:hypothetical protein
MSAAELLAECQARYIDLQAHGEQLDIDAPAGALTDELLQRLRDAKPELLVMLQPHYAHGDAGQDAAAVAAPRSAVPVAVEWPGAAADFCLLLTADDLPATPFALNGWTTITDAAKFLRSLRGDIAAGPSGPRAFYGALQADLLELQRFVLQAAENESVRTGDGPKGKNS